MMKVLIQVIYFGRAFIESIIDKIYEMKRSL